MKRYFLSYNGLTKEYYLDYGCFDRQRQFLGKADKEKLVKKLVEILPMQRSITIYAQKDLDDSLKSFLLNNFKNTRVNVQFEKNLESLC